MKSATSSPAKGAVVQGRDGSLVVQEDFLKFYKDSGLEPLAREVSEGEKVCRNATVQRPHKDIELRVSCCCQFVRDSLFIKTSAAGPDFVQNLDYFSFSPLLLCPAF